VKTHKRTPQNSDWYKIFGHRYENRAIFFQKWDHTILKLVLFTMMQKPEINKEQTWLYFFSMLSVLLIKAKNKKCWQWVKKTCTAYSNSSSTCISLPSTLFMFKFISVCLWWLYREFHCDISLWIIPWIGSSTPLFYLSPIPMVISTGLNVRHSHLWIESTSTIFTFFTFFIYPPISVIPLT
jgi:hypothetical protein